MRKPLQEFGHDQSPYERPNQDWVCGWARDGQPCRVGPSLKGRCRARYECKPLLKGTDASPQGGKNGDRWFCTRPTSAGGPCDTGPRPDGKCARRIPRCQPYRSLRAKRGLAVRAVVTLTVGIGLLVLGGSQLRGIRAAILSPGDLSGNHSAVETCDACHAASGENVNTFAAGLTTAPGITDQCVACHRPTGRDALGTHGVASARLAEVTERSGPPTTPPLSSPVLALAALGPGVPTGSDGQHACSMCHTEHRGRQFDLAAMDSRRCQACHVTKFVGFTRDHPELSDFPPGRTTSDYYEHGMHQEETGTLRCSECHTPGLNGSEILVRDYDAMCADCHEEDMRDLTPAFTGAPKAPISRLTRFDHAPHLVAACSTCHQTGSQANFGPITKSMCSTCHTTGKTAETCLTCHAYHGARFQLTGVR